MEHLRKTRKLDCAVPINVDLVLLVIFASWVSSLTIVQQDICVTLAILPLPLMDLMQVLESHVLLVSTVPLGR